MSIIPHLSFCKHVIIIATGTVTIYDVYNILELDVCVCVYIHIILGGNNLLFHIALYI